MNNFEVNDMMVFELLLVMSEVENRRVILSKCDQFA